MPNLQPPACTPGSREALTGLHTMVNINLKTNYIYFFALAARKLLANMEVVRIVPFFFFFYRHTVFINIQTNFIIEIKL